MFRPLAAVLILAACAPAPAELPPPVGPDPGGAAFDSGAESDAGAGRDAGMAAAHDAGVTADAGPSVDAGTFDAGAFDAGNWHAAIGDCWTDAHCQRALLVSHGGDWDVTLSPPIPYGSFAAFTRAWDGGTDAVKMDLRMTADHVAVAVHSSPLNWYESLDCAGQYIEQMTAAQVTQCHLFPSTTETFQRTDTLLSWARGKVLVMLTVKLSTDLAGGIQTAYDNGAQDYVFFETNPTDFQMTIPDAGHWDQFHYLVNIADLADVGTMLALNDPRAFAYEMTSTYADAGTSDLSALISSRLHPAGVKAFVATSTTLPQVQEHLDLFNEGFDIVMTYDLTNGVEARTQIDEARGVTPP